MDLVTMLKKCPEPLPEWLQKPALRFDRASFFGSRTVYYPGFGNDGHPVSICARAHAAHAFVGSVANLSKGQGDPGRTTCSTYVSARARWSCRNVMASVRAHGPTPKARSTILASPTTPS